jgi:hypothetical protein
VDAVSMLAFFPGWEPEVGYFEVISSVKEDVLGLEITMDYSTLVMQVLNRTEELLEVIARKRFVKSTFWILDFYVGEQVTLFDELKHNKVDLNCLARVFDDYFAVAVVLYEPDDVWMAHLL